MKSAPECQREFTPGRIPQLPHSLADALQDELAGLEQTLVDAAGVLNTPSIVERTTADPRYGWEKNKGVPRKIGSKLWLYDCINCDKCVPVCPNDANFVYETDAADIAYDNFELLPGGAARRVPGGAFKVAKAHQLANYADACNDCGNCDVFCPEDGGPYIEKPRFFGSLELPEVCRPQRLLHRFASGGNTIHGTIAGKPYRLDARTARAAARRLRRRQRRSRDPAQRPRRAGAGQLKPGCAAPHTRRHAAVPELKLLMESQSAIRGTSHFANVAGTSGRP